MPSRLFFLLGFLILLSSCRGFHQIESGGDLVRDDRHRIKDLESILEGQFVVHSPAESEGRSCPGQRVEFVGSLIRLTEVVYSKPPCGGVARGEVISLGRVSIGALSLEDAGARPMNIEIQEVRAKALVPGWGFTGEDPCGLRTLGVGESKIVTGRKCEISGGGARGRVNGGRFPAAGEIYQTSIAINSGQKIKIDRLPRVFQNPQPDRSPAGVRSQGPVEFERSQL